MPFPSNGGLPVSTPRSAIQRRIALVASLSALAAGSSPLIAQSTTLANSQRSSYSAPHGSKLVTVTAHDFAFQFPDTLPAGLVTFRLVNDGKENHHMTVVRLDSGRTGEEAFSALRKAGRGVRPAWMHFVGGPNEVDPGGASNATLLLEPGDYLAFCEVPGPDPVPHFAKGMVKAFTVTPPARDAELPASDLTITLSDYTFTFSRPLTRGHHVIAVKNAASQPHMLVIHREEPGQGLKEFLAWAEDPHGAPQPGEGWGGVTTIAPGSTVVFDEDYLPGHYFLICFTPDARDGKAHFLHGMQEEIEIK
jgi:hypothetical protein